MTETIELKAASRTSVGKANRRLATSGLLPAVLYGVGTAAAAIAVDRHDFEMLASHQGLTSSLIKLTVDDHKPVTVLVKAVQRDAVKGTLLHVDFWAVSMTQKITTAVAIHFVGESPGVKVGGVLTHNAQQVHVESLPAEIPDSLEADVSGLEIGDALHMSDLVAPSGVVILDSPDEIICSVQAPKAVEVEEEEVAEEAAEPEVIGETPDESGE
jgi:large subunit ribosomal protein L25